MRHFTPSNNSCKGAPYTVELQVIVALIILVLTFVLILTEHRHSTVAAMVGAALMIIAMKAFGNGFDVLYNGGGAGAITFGTIIETIGEETGSNVYSYTYEINPLISLEASAGRETIEQEFNPFILKYIMTINDNPPIDRRLLISAGILLAGIEGRQR